MLELFRTLVLALSLIAPGDVGCNRPIAQATVCWVSFRDPYFVEYISPANPHRIMVLAEIKEIEKNK